jgi:hypothetical protein
MQLHFRENIECLREDILKKEKALAERKDKLFLNKDGQLWGLENPSPDQI